MTTTNTMEFISINHIAKRDGKAGKLFQNIGAANENGDTLDIILALETELDELKAARPDYEYIPTMIDWLTEAKENAENAANFEAIKAETLASTGDEDLAEELAWDLVYSQSAKHTEKSPAIDFSKFSKAYDMIHTETKEERQHTSELNSAIKVFA